MIDIRNLGAALQEMWRGMLAEPSAVSIEDETLRAAIIELDPQLLLKLMKWQVCARPGPDTQVLVPRGRRLGVGRDYRRSVLPKITGARTVDFGEGLTLRFAEHPASDQFMRRVLPKVGLHEPELVEYLRRTTRPGDLVVDIGAHVGYVSCVAAAFGATVIAAEIQPTLIPLIQVNAALNDLWRVHPMCVAIGDRVGLVPTLRVSPSPGLQATVWHWDTAEFPLSSQNHDCIPCLTLDSLFPGDELPDLVKIDVEGGEGRVLAGARKLIQAGRTRFMVEIHAHLLGTFETTAMDLLAMFDPDCWSMSMLTTAGLEPLSRDAFLDADGPVALHTHNAPVLFEPRGR